MFEGDGKPNLLNMRFIVACLLGFTGSLRIEELLCVKLRNVQIFEGHMLIYIEKSKVDQHRDGKYVHIAKTGSKYCPVSFLEIFLANGV